MLRSGPVQRGSRHGLDNDCVVDGRRCCLTFGLINLRVAIGQKQPAPYLFFFATSLAVASLAGPGRRYFRSQFYTTFIIFVLALVLSLYHISQHVAHMF